MNRFVPLIFLFVAYVIVMLIFTDHFLFHIGMSLFPSRNHSRSNSSSIFVDALPFPFPVSSRGGPLFPNSRFNSSPIFLDALPFPFPVSSRSGPLLPCNWTAESIHQPTRSLCFLQCSNNDSAILYKEVDSNNSSITTIYPKDIWCLKRVIQSACNDVGRRVPRVAHYVHFGAYNITIDAFISVIAVSRFIKPCLVVYHADTIPHGPYWRALLHLVPNIVHVQTTKPTSIFNKIIRVVEHSADVKRLQVLREYGGFYLDPDHILLRTLYDLRNESAVIGLESSNSGANGFLVAEPNASFIRIWLDNYRDFNDGQWNAHSCYRPFQLSKQHPQLVKVVNNFFRPNWAEIGPYFDRAKVPKFDWYNVYSFHMYTRLVKAQVFNGKRLDKQDNVIGDMIRHVLFGDQFACMHTWKPR